MCSASTTSSVASRWADCCDTTSAGQRDCCWSASDQRIPPPCTVNAPRAFRSRVRVPDNTLEGDKLQGSCWPQPSPASSVSWDIFCDPTPPKTYCTRKPSFTLPNSLLISSATSADGVSWPSPSSTRTLKRIGRLALALISRSRGMASARS